MRTSPHAALAAAALVCLAAAGPLGPAQAAEDGPIVPTTAGPVLGATESGLEVFRGIPYAAPPIDDRRWLPPAPVAPWTDVRDATSFGPACPQDPDLHEMAEGTPTSEDCLTLNVWTPSTGGQAPVMVFIHGGGFTAGSTWDPWYDGAAFARRGVVLVTLQYRIGPFGWLDVSDMGPEYATSGNNGLQDQMAALRWVRENAAAFGGDPGNVTLFAESAGAISVSRPDGRAGSRWALRPRDPGERHRGHGRDAGVVAAGLRQVRRALGGRAAAGPCRAHHGATARHGTPHLRHRVLGHRLPSHWWTAPSCPTCR